ncbi:MAG: dephospho-CoA kinase [Ignavibacteria bacterium RIFOXYA2_FULL_37_17]|nr:MAG: dephospho-CoA kinase [Ignavibacteria bacterium RIFOXYA2_FULL_37_17]
MKNKIKIAITGGIGSGKSSVSKIIESFGFPVIKADDLAKELMLKDESVKKKIIKTFGKESFTEKGINTKYLAENVFNSKDKVDKINSIIHPVTIRKIEVISKELFEKHDLVFVESALVYEAKIQKLFDYVILIYAEEEIRILRKLDKNGMNKADIEKRMSFQIPDEKKTNRAHFVIDNNSTFDKLESRTKFVVELIKATVV